jgi:hypothetical protein
VRHVAYVALRNVNAGSNFGLLSPKTHQATQVQFSDNLVPTMSVETRKKESSRDAQRSARRHPTPPAEIQKVRQKAIVETPTSSNQQLPTDS